MTEPGIIGKIGLNSSGLGTTLNILSSDQKSSGAPIHIMLRLFLDCHTLQDCDEKVRKFGLGKCSSITVGDSKGDVRHYEFHPLEVHTVPVDSKLKVVYRTNHYLTPSLQSSNLPSTHPSFKNSFYRFQRTHDLVFQLQQSKSILDTQDMLKILNDQEVLKDTDFCIWSRYKPLSRFAFNGGTICTIVMDLKKKKMILLKGPSSPTWKAPFNPSSPLWLTSLSPYHSESTTTTTSNNKESKKKRKSSESMIETKQNGKKQKKSLLQEEERKKRKRSEIPTSPSNLNEKKQNLLFEQVGDSLHIREEEMIDTEKVENNKNLIHLNIGIEKRAKSPKHYQMKTKALFFESYFSFFGVNVCTFFSQ